MRKFIQTLILLFFLNNCNSPPKIQLKGKTNWTPEGTWYLTDVGTGRRLRKTPVFAFGNNNEFLDISQSVCRLEKIESGDIQITSISPTPFIDFEEPPKLQKCPSYMYAWDADGIVILHSDQSATKPKINFAFAPSEAWQVNLYVNREFRLIARIGGKNTRNKGFYPSEISFPMLKGQAR